MSPHPYMMRTPCLRCRGTVGRVDTRNGQDCIYCSWCGAYQYNAPRTETGRRERTPASVHAGIGAGKRTRILLRAGGRCELCGARPDQVERALQVGHLLSVADGLRLGLGEEQINHEENLAALCDECNHGLSDETVPLRLVVSILMARYRRVGILRQRLELPGES